MKTHNVEISLDNGRPCVDWSDLKVHRGDEITWSSCDEEPFMLFFRDRPPFKSERKKLILTEKGSVTRAVEISGERVRTYKYFVFFHDEMLDPVIIVEPH